jgi:excisionase family DNA binding protein
MPRTSLPTTALYVRLPTAEADKLDRAARALGVPKKVLVTGLVAALGDPDSQRAPGGAGALSTRRVTVEAGADAMSVGSYSFQPYELPEVLTPEQAGQLLQLAEPVVVELAETGQLPGRMLGGAWRFSRAGLLAWLSRGTDQES